MSREKRTLFYNAYILPHLDYCCTSSLEDKNAKFQKQATRFILDRDFKTPPKEHFAKPKWQTSPERVIYQKAIVIYKKINKICPDYLKYHITYTSEICNRDTRSNNSVKLYIPKPTCEFFMCKSFMYSGTGIVSL